MEQNVITVFNRKVNISTSAGRRAHTILRQCEILQDSAQIIDTSNNLDTVMRRIDKYEEILHFLANCPASDLKMCRLNTPQKFNEMYQNWNRKKVNVINKAIIRSVEQSSAHVKTLKTKKGVFDYMDKCFETISAVSGLLPENKALIEELHQEWEDAKKL